MILIWLHYQKFHFKVDLKIMFRYVIGVFWNEEWHNLIKIRDFSHCSERNRSKTRPFFKLLMKLSSKLIIIEFFDFRILRRKGDYSTCEKMNWEPLLCELIHGRFQFRRELMDHKVNFFPFWLFRVTKPFVLLTQRSSQDMWSMNLYWNPQRDRRHRR